MKFSDQSQYDAINDCAEKQLYETALERIREKYQFPLFFVYGAVYCVRLCMPHI